MYSFFTHFAQVFFPATRVVNATDNFSISAPKRASEIIAKCINQLSELILEYRSEREREIVGERERGRVTSQHGKWQSWSVGTDRLPDDQDELTKIFTLMLKCVISLKVEHTPLSHTFSHRA